MKRLWKNSPEARVFVPESAVEPSEATSPELETDSSADDNEEIFAAFQQENANLKKLLDEKSQQADLAKAQYARLAADFENFRRRTTKEKENLEVQAKKNVITELLPVIDNFERARTQLKPESDGEKAIHSSYQGVYKTLVECLKKMGVSAMRPEGQEFDPQLSRSYVERSHQRTSRRYCDRAANARIYTIGDTILRHAMVKVAVPQEPVITSEQKTTENEESDS